MGIVSLNLLKLNFILTLPCKVNGIIVYINIFFIMLLPGTKQKNSLSIYFVKW